MIPGFESHFDFDAASAELRELTRRVAERMVPAGEPLLIPSEQQLSTGEGCRLYVVTEGGLKIRDDERVLMTFEEGECVIDPPAPLVLSAPDFAVRVHVLSSEQCAAEPALFGVIKGFFADLWMGVVATVVRPTADLLPRSRVYDAGETIIEQGTVGQEVYTLIDGEAEAYVDGVLVGEVKTNEFFGVIATVTDTPRTARVVAKTQCAVLSVQKDRFHELIAARPVLVEKLIVELGRTIVDLNARVVKMTQGAPVTK